jgi:hypothetical protein
MNDDNENNSYDREILYTLEGSPKKRNESNENKENFGVNYLKEDKEDFSHTAHFQQNNETGRSEVQKNNNKNDYINDMTYNSKLFDMKAKNLEGRDSKNKNNLKNEHQSDDYDLKEKLKSIEKNSENEKNAKNEKIKNYEDNSEIIKENAKLNNEINYKNLLVDEQKKEIEKLKEELKRAQNSKKIISDKYMKEIDNLLIENSNKDEMVKTLNTENEKCIKVIEESNKEISKYKLMLTKIKEEKKIINEKYDLLLEDKNDFDRKIRENNQQLKNFKLEYENLTKNSVSLKKQIDSLKLKEDEYKTDNYNLIQENKELKLKLEKFINKRISNIGTDSSVRIENYSPKNSPKSKTFTNIILPSESQFHKNKSEISKFENNLSTLYKEKITIENDLFKLPERPRTLNEINKKRNLEECLDIIENKINDSKVNIRKLNGK